MNYTNSLWRPLYYSHIKTYMFREVGTSFINNICKCTYMLDHFYDKFE